jgi:oligopeptidase B
LVAALAIRRSLAAATPPRAWKKRFMVKFGHVPGAGVRGLKGEDLISPPIERPDDYFWMRDDSRSHRSVLNHIKAENKYAQEAMRHTEPLQKVLYDEFLAHLREDDDSTPYPHGRYLYWTRTVKGQPYGIKMRKLRGQREGEGAQQEQVLDINAVAEGHDYCDVQDAAVSPDHSLLAFSVDNTGGETYDVRFRAISSGEEAFGALSGTSGGHCWGADESVLYYTTQDAEHRPYRLYRHVVGTPQEEDVLLHEENDQTLWMGVGKTMSERFLILTLESKTTSECWFIDLEGVRGAEAHCEAPLQLVSERQDGIRYELEHSGELFYILTNAQDCPNQKLVAAPIGRPSAENWEELQPHDPAVELKDIACFEKYLVLSGRQDGYSQLWVRSLSTGETHRIEHSEEVRSVGFGVNYEFRSSVLRFHYGSLTTPSSTFDYDMDLRERVLVKEKEVPNYDRALYASERRLAKGHDGTMIPISLLYRRDLFPDGLDAAQAPCMLYGYGSYGHSIDPEFSPTRLSYLDRGVVFVLGHIRGGGEMGRLWYERDGKFLTKRNTFEDFCSCAEALIQYGITQPSKLSICGRSAGGLLIGATLNLRPELFACAVADVPFLDCLNTMVRAAVCGSHAPPSRLWLTHAPCSFSAVRLDHTAHHRRVVGMG